MNRIVFCPLLYLFLKVDDRLGGVVASAELQVLSDVYAAGDVVS